MIGFGDYLVFSDLLYPTTMGSVKVLHNNMIVKEIIGDPGTSIGEYIVIGEDSPGGNIVIGISGRVANSNYDSFHLYKLMQTIDGTFEMFDYSESTLTIIEPSMGSIDEILASRGTSASVNYSNGNMMIERSGATKNFVACPPG